ncbi:MAG: class I SAM-dependent methyltransferase [Micrococcales bacterium]|nr:class I SAM-dependent methyltransferase [Micrococcales bacterium]
MTHHHHDGGETPAQAADPRGAAFWDERYSSSDRLWSGHVNEALAEIVGPLTPGRALDAGCGEGGDGLWLAERGWEVTGTDVSGVAVARAEAQAERLGLGDRTRWEQRDLLEWAPPPATFDLVLAAFIHLPSADRFPAYRALAEAVRPGGSFVVLAHHPTDVGVVPRPPEPDLFFTEDELAAELDPDQWKIVAAVKRPRSTTHPEGHEVIVHDTLLHARRR